MSEALAQLLRRTIETEGPISFAQFMKAALYDPEHGFYGSGRAGIGKSGDFYTNVSVGPLFGRLLARQFHEMWRSLGQPADWTLVEQGANDGQLAFDILEALQKQSPDCFKATKLVLVEPIGLLHPTQRAKLETYSGKVTWLRELADLTPFEGVHYSNELLDAFPIHFLQKRSGHWSELKVDWRRDGFSWTETPVSEAWLLETAAIYGNAPENFRIEIFDGHHQVLETVFEKMRRGWLLAFDYGMSSEERLQPHRGDGTLATFRKHRRDSNVLIAPGEKDITAQVDFSVFGKIALERGWQIAGYTDQHRFFTGLAPLHFPEHMETMSLEEQRERLAFRSLTHPQLMGMQFKVIAFQKLREAPPIQLSGFRFASNPTTLLGLS